MKLPATYIVIAIGGIIFSTIHYFAVANQYIAGGTVTNFYIVNATYIIWTCIFVMLAINGGFLRSFFLFLLIFPLLSVVGRDLMYIGSIGFTIILAILFGGFRRIVA